MATLASNTKRWLSAVDDLLRGKGAPAPSMAGASPMNLHRLAIILIVFGAIYGAAMGSFGSEAGNRALQMLYSAVKMPILLLCTFALSLPSFFVVNTLFGLRDDFADAIRGLLSTQAALTVILASFAPFTLLVYISTDNYDFAVLFNALMFGIASIAAQLVLKRAYKPLIAKNAKHRTLLRAWMGIYAFIGIQMGWILRPFIGKGDLETHFFRDNAWGNAYIEVLRKVLELVG
jgi:hypothetical protein